MLSVESSWDESSTPGNYHCLPGDVEPRIKREGLESVLKKSLPPPQPSFHGKETCSD